MIDCYELMSHNSALEVQEKRILSMISNSTITYSKSNRRFEPETDSIEWSLVLWSALNIHTHTRSKDNYENRWSSD